MMCGARLDVPETQQLLILGKPGKDRHDTPHESGSEPVKVLTARFRESTLTLSRTSVSVWSDTIWQKAQSSSGVPISVVY